MTAASQPQHVTLRSGAVVRIRQVRPDDARAWSGPTRPWASNLAIVRLPVSTVLKTWRPGPRPPDPSDDP